MEYNKINHRPGLTKREKSKIIAKHFDRIAFNYMEVATFFIYQVKNEKNVANKQSHSEVVVIED